MSYMILSKQQHLSIRVKRLHAFAMHVPAPLIRIGDSIGAVVIVMLYVLLRDMAWPATEAPSHLPTHPPPSLPSSL